MTKSPTATEEPHLRGARQLYELFDLRNVKVLRSLRTPNTASAIASDLELPVSLVHYRINKLLEVGLLHIREESSRSRIFETTHETSVVPPARVGELRDALSMMLTTLLNLVYREFFSEFEKMSLALSTFDEAGDKVTVDLERNIGVDGEQMREDDRFHFTPHAVVTTVRMSEERYSALAKELSGAIGNAKDEEGGERCTFTMLGYRGGSLR